MFLAEKAEVAKIELSQMLDTTVVLPGFLKGSKGAHALYQKITRKEFEEHSLQLVKRASLLLSKTLESAGFHSRELDSVIILGGTCKIPIIRETICKQLGIMPTKFGESDLNVVHGNCIRAGIMSGEIKSVLLLEKTAYSYGIKLDRDEISILIEKNTTIPVKKTQVFTTSSDSQRELKIHIYQGEKTDVREAHCIGSLTLNDFSARPAGVTKIEVIFDLDANHILHASIINLDTGRKQSKDITPPFSLTEVQLQAMCRRMSEWQRNQSIREIAEQVEEIQASSYGLVSLEEKNVLHNMLIHLKEVAKNRRKTSRIFSFAFSQIKEKIKNCQKCIADVEISKNRVRNQNEDLVQEIEAFFSKHNQFISMIEPEDLKHLHGGWKHIEDCIERKLPQDEMNRQLLIVTSGLDNAKNKLLETFCKRQDIQELKKELIHDISGTIRDPKLFLPAMHRIWMESLSIDLRKDFRALLSNANIKESNLSSIALKDRQIASALIILTTFLIDEKTVLALLKAFIEEDKKEENLVLFALFFILARDYDSNCRQDTIRLLLSRETSNLYRWFFLFRYREKTTDFKNDFLLTKWLIPVEDFWSYYQQAPSKTKKMIQQDNALLKKTLRNLVMGKPSAERMVNPSEILSLYLFLKVHISCIDSELKGEEAMFLTALSLNSRLPYLIEGILSWMLTNYELSSPAKHISPFYAHYKDSDENINKLIRRDANLWIAIIQLCFELESCETISASAATIATLKKYKELSNLDLEIWGLVNNLKIRKEFNCVLLDLYHNNTSKRKPTNDIMHFLYKFSGKEIILLIMERLRDNSCYSDMMELLKRKCLDIPDGGEELFIVISALIREKTLPFLAKRLLDKMQRNYPELIGIKKVAIKLAEKSFNE
jgi:hypothetical protein